MQGKANADTRATKPPATATLPTAAGPARIPRMEIRPAKPADIAGVDEIDGTIESTRYLHVDRSGQGFSLAWRIEERPLRDKLIVANRLDDERAFSLKQIAGGIDEGFCQVVDLDGQLIGLLLAQSDPTRATMRILDVRVDYDYRRQGLGMALVYGAVNYARELEMRAVVAETLTNNFAANQLMVRCGFELSGIDQRRNSNHDLVKEAVTLIWYASLD